MLPRARTVKTWRQAFLLAPLLVLAGCGRSPNASTPSSAITRISSADGNEYDAAAAIEGTAVGVRPDQQIVVYTGSDELWWRQPAPSLKTQEDRQSRRPFVLLTQGWSPCTVGLCRSAEQRHFSEASPPGRPILFVTAQRPSACYHHSAPIGFCMSEFAFPAPRPKRIDLGEFVTFPQDTLDTASLRRVSSCLHSIGLVMNRFLPSSTTPVEVPESGCGSTSNLGPLWTSSPAIPQELSVRAGASSESSI